MSISVETLALAKKNTKQAVEEAVTSVYRYKGSVETFEDLPTSGQKVGDVYNVADEAGKNYAWDGSNWDALGIAENLGDVKFQGPNAAGNSVEKTINGNFWDAEKIGEEIEILENSLNNSINAVSNELSNDMNNVSNTFADLGNIEFQGEDWIEVEVSLDGNNDRVTINNIDYIRIPLEDLVSHQFLFTCDGLNPGQSIYGHWGFSNYEDHISTTSIGGGGNIQNIGNNQYLYTVNSSWIDQLYKYCFIPLTSSSRKEIFINLTVSYKIMQEKEIIKTINQSFYNKYTVDKKNQVIQSAVNIVTNNTNQAWDAANQAKHVANNAYNAANIANNSLNDLNNNINKTFADLGNVEFLKGDIQYQWITYKLSEWNIRSNSTPGGSSQGQPPYFVFKGIPLLTDGDIDNVYIDYEGDIFKSEMDGANIGFHSGSNVNQPATGGVIGGTIEKLENQNTLKLNLNASNYAYNYPYHFCQVYKNNYPTFSQIFNDIENNLSNITLRYALKEKTYDTATINADYYDKDATNSLTNDTLNAAKAYTDSKFDISLKKEVVQVLPAQGEDNILYLVPKTDAETEDIYDEYIWTNNDWEKIGSTATDLSGYYTSNEVDNLISNVSNQATCAEALARSASNEATAIRNNFSNIEFTGFKENIETISHNLTSNYVIVNQETGQKTTIGVPIENIAEEFDEENENTQQRYMYLTYTCESEIFDNWEIGDYDQFDVVVGNSETDISYKQESQDFYKIGEKQLRIPLVLYDALIKGYTYVGLPLQDWAQRDLFSDLTQVTWSYNYVYYGFSEEPVTLAQDYYTKGQMMTYVKDTQEIANKVYENKEQEIYQTISNTTNLAQTAYNAVNAATNLAQDAYNRATEKWGVVDTYTTSAGDNSISLTIDKEYEEYLVTFNHPCKHDGPNISNVFTNENPIYTAQMGGTYIFSNTGGVGNSLATYPTMEAYYKLEKIQGSTYLVTAHSKNNLKGSFAEDSLKDIFTINYMYNSGIHLSVGNGAFEEGIVVTVYGKHGEEVE